jgi:methionine sulfoxide reductase heme-binding subunit
VIDSAPPASPPAGGAKTSVASGWSVTGWIAAALVAASAIHFLVLGSEVEAVRAWIRATARSSLALFLLAFCARPLRQLWRAPASAWLLANRRYVAVGFAVSHALHGIGITWFAVAWPEIYHADPVTIVAGGLTYFVIAAMTATSNDRAVARLGRARWQRLHRIGSWTIWTVFFFTFGGQAAHSPLHAVLTGTLLLGAALRLAARHRRRRARCPA